MKSSRRTQLLLMLVSISLLTILSGLWIHSSFNNKRLAMRQGATLQLRSAIFDLEDSLRQGMLIRKDGTPLSSFLPDSLPRDSVRIRMFRGPDNNRRLMRRRREDRNPGVFQGALSLHMRLSNQDTSSELFGTDSTLLSTLIPLLQDKLDEINGDEWRINVVHLKEGNSSDSHQLQTRTYQDVFGDFQLVGNIQNYTKNIWRQLIPEILMCLLLLVFTCAAFLVTYRSSEYQRRLVALKDDLISNISHELQTPISTIKVALEALDGNKDISPRHKEYMAISKNEINRLSGLVDQILIESADPGSLNIEKIDLLSLVQDAVQMMSIQVSRRDAKISVQSDQIEYRFQGDKSKLQTVLINLIDNALKYSPENPKIEVILGGSENSLTLEVKDHGIGIPSAYHGQVFDRLFRVPTGDRHDIKGYGLGLSQVQSIVHAHGGTVRLKSKEGSGTSFILKFPRYV